MVSGEAETRRSPSNAMASIGLHPFGGVALALLAAGLACYALWKLVQGALDADGKGSGPHGILRRVGYVGSAAIHGAIGLAGAFVVLAAYQSDQSETRSLGEALESLQQQPFDSYMLGAIAAGLLVYGLFMFAIARYRRIDPALPSWDRISRYGPPKP